MLRRAPRLERYRPGGDEGERVAELGHARLRPLRDDRRRVESCTHASRAASGDEHGVRVEALVRPAQRGLRVLPTTLLDGDVPVRRPAVADVDVARARGNDDPAPVAKRVPGIRELEDAAVVAGIVLGAGGVLEPAAADGARRLVEARATPLEEDDELLGIGDAGSRT